MQGRAKIPEDDLTTVLTTTPLFSTNASYGAFGGLDHDVANNKNPTAVDDVGGTTPSPLT
jgi:hypothetical protein